MVILWNILIKIGLKDVLINLMKILYANNTVTNLMEENWQIYREQQSIIQRGSSLISDIQHLWLKYD